MATQRTIDALRSLAARPGTPAEGRAARAILRKLEGKVVIDDLTPLRKYLRTGNMDAFIKQYARASRHPLTCACGATYPFGTRCQATDRHGEIRAQIKDHFPRGTRVFYNRWAYTKNCAGIVAGYPDANSQTWGWLRIQFDHLKSVRSVPIFSAAGWHLSLKPLPDSEIGNLRGPMGVD